MVKALLAGTKTQTRRIVKLGDGSEPVVYNGKVWKPGEIDWEGFVECPYGQPGDRLWVRETYIRGGNGKPVHCADADSETLGLAQDNGFKKTPSIFMRRWESRLTLELTGSRVERLQDITESDAIAEGSREPSLVPIVAGCFTERDAYAKLWNHINLAPSPVGVRDESGKLKIVSYTSFPWSAESFDRAYRGVREAGIYRGKPISVTPNPWVWVIEFHRIAQAIAA